MPRGILNHGLPSTLADVADKRPINRFAALELAERRIVFVGKALRLRLRHRVAAHRAGWNRDVAGARPRRHRARQRLVVDLAP